MNGCPKCLNDRQDVRDLLGVSRYLAGIDFPTQFHPFLGELLDGWSMDAVLLAILTVLDNVGPDRSFYDVFELKARRALEMFVSIDPIKDADLGKVFFMWDSGCDLDLYRDLITPESVVRLTAPDSEPAKTEMSLRLLDTLNEI